MSDAESLRSAHTNEQFTINHCAQCDLDPLHFPTFRHNVVIMVVYNISGCLYDLDE